MCCPPRGRVSTTATKLLLFLMVYLILAYIQKKRKENQSEDENEWELQTAVASSSLIMPSTQQTTRSKYKYVLHIREQTEEVFCFLTGNWQGEAGWQVALRLPIKRKFVSAKSEGVTSLHRFVALFTIQICEPLLEPRKVVLCLLSSFPVNSKVPWAGRWRSSTWVAW